MTTGIAAESNVTCDVSSLSDGERSISLDLSHTPLGLTITSNSRAEQTCSKSTSADSDTKRTSKRSNEDNPWPYLKDYFTFICKKSNRKNLEFRCISCKPKVKNLSTSILSANNLRKHF